MRDRRHRGDERGTSTTLGYVLALSITVVLVSGLIIAGSGFVTRERQQVVRSELDVLGDRVVADISGADNLVQTASTTGTVRLQTRLPETTAGVGYTVSIVNRTAPGDDRYHYVVVLEASRPGVTVNSSVRTRTPVEEVSVSGGNLVVAWDAHAGTLEVQKTDD